MRLWPDYYEPRLVQGIHGTTMSGEHFHAVKGFVVHIEDIDAMMDKIESCEGTVPLIWAVIISAAALGTGVTVTALAMGG